MADRGVAGDWFPAEIPGNVELAESVYIDSSYAFDRFLSKRTPGLTMGFAAGAYNRTTFVVGPRGAVAVGAYTCLNNTYIVCHDSVTIGDHCLLSWGVVVSDANSPMELRLDARRAALQAASVDADRWVPAATPPRPVVLEDNVWVGFDSVILPGVTLGRGCIVGCKTVVDHDVPPYAIFVGEPGRVVRFLTGDDTDEARQVALEECVRER